MDLILFTYLIVKRGSIERGRRGLSMEEQSLPSEGHCNLRYK